MVNIEPDELPDDADVFIAGAGLKTIIAAATLKNDSTIIFDSTGAIFYSGPKELYGRTLEGDMVTVKLKNTAYIHIASCDTNQCISKSMDEASLYSPALTWPVIDEKSGRVPLDALIEFDENGATLDREKGQIAARTRYGQNVEFRLDHIGYLRISSLGTGVSTREFGLHGGLNLAALHGGDSPVATTENSGDFGIYVGLVGRQWLRPWFNVQGELNLVRRGAERTYIRSDSDGTFTVTDKISLTYLEIPALARLHVKDFGPAKGHVFVGPYMAINLGAMTEFDSTQALAGFSVGSWGTAEITNSNTVVYGLVLGGDIEYPLGGINAWLDIRYAIDLSSFTSKWQEPTDLNDGTRALLDETGDDLKLRTNDFTVSLGLSIPY
jgi:hypothetical protein